MYAESLLTTIFEPGNVEVISETDSKAITAFSNDGSDSELCCENFLHDVMTLAKSKSLTEQACKNLLYRKLQAGARSLLDSHLDLHSIS